MKEETGNTQETTQIGEVRPAGKVSRLRVFFHNVIIGDVFSKDSFFRTIPYLGYLTVLAIIYISNTYYAEKTFRQIEKIKVELKEQRFQYISSKSELMYYGKQTEIAKRVTQAGLKATTIPPYKIFYGQDSLNPKETETK